MKDFLLQAWPILLPLLLVIGYLLYVLKTKGKEAALSELRELAYALMIKAQKKFGDGNGHIKMDWVVERLKPILPEYVWLFASEEDFIRWLQTLYDETLDLLDNGKLDGSYKK